MNKTYKFLFYLLIINIGFVFIISCKKDSTPTSPTINSIIFNTNIIYGSITDVDSNVYKTVKIGTQTWMAENLKVTHYTNDSVIPNVTDDFAWDLLNSGAYCDYGNILTISTIYGRLYNWYAVNNGNLCPTGWHVPNDAEWTTLSEYLGGDSIAGCKLKEIGLSHWNATNSSTINETGFTALPSGNRCIDGPYYFINDLGEWWSSSEFDPHYAWQRSINSTYNNFKRNCVHKNNGSSVRCLKD